MSSTFIPFVIIKGQVTDSIVSPDGLVSASGINFIDNGVSPTFNFNNVWFVLNNCFVQTSNASLPIVAMGLAGSSYVQLQDCMAYGSFNNTSGYVATIQDNAGIYSFLSDIFGSIRLNGAGFPYFYGGYNLFGSNDYFITMNSINGFVEIWDNLIYSNLAFWNFLVNASGSSINDIYETYDPSTYCGIGTGNLAIANAIFETNFGSNQNFSPTITVVYIPTSDLSLSTVPAGTATTGGAILPPQPASFLPVTINGVAYKIPLYNP